MAATPLSDLPIRCFSQISNLRCQGLTTIQLIATYIPAACLIFILPFILISTYRLPRATLLLLGIEIILQLGIHSWNLGYYLDRPSFNNFRTTDTALAIASSTPILVFLFALTSHFLGDIRPHLPPSFQGRISTVIYIILIAPLVPLGFVGSLLGSFLSVRIRDVRGSIYLDFAGVLDEWVNVVLIAIGTIAAYILCISLCALIPLLHPPSSNAYLTSTPTLRPLIVSTISILLAGAEIALGLVPPTSIPRTVAVILIIARSVLLLLSRAGLVGGLMWMYNITEVKRQRRSSIFVGGPIRGTFRKMDQEGTMEFYGVHSKARGGGLPVQPPMKVVLRRPQYRAPKLSFTSATFAPALPHPALLQPEPAFRPRIHPEQARKARMNLGSIYNPRRVTVDPLDFAQWPMPVQSEPRAPPRPESETLPLPIITSGEGVEPLRSPSPPVERSTGTEELNRKRDSGEEDDYDLVPPNRRLLISTFSVSTTTATPSPTSLHSNTPCSPTSSNREASKPIIRQTPKYRTPLATPSPHPSRAPSAFPFPPTSPSRTSSGRRRPTLSTSALPTSGAGTGVSARSSSLSLDINRHMSGEIGDQGRYSPVSSYQESNDNHPKTLFYVTPKSSPCLSPMKDEYLNDPYYSLGKVGAERLSDYSPSRLSGPSVESPKRGRERAATMASLARLRLETGIPIDPDRMGTMSIVSSDAMDISRRGSEVDSMGMRYSAVSAVSEASTPKARMTVLPDEGRGAWWVARGQ